MANTEATFAILSLSRGTRVVCIRLEILVVILDVPKMQYHIFWNFLSHFCMYFDFSLMFQALKTPRNGKSTFFY